MKLSVSENKRYFTLDGKPFFWLGDTAWFMFSKLGEEEAKTYLINRRAKGFTVIQATLVHTYGYATPEGAKAFADDDFARPIADAGENGYWRRVRRLVDFAKEQGLFMGLLPSWGKFVKDGRLNAQNAAGYVRFLADTFGECENVVWIVGGDIRGDVNPEVFNIIGSELKQLCPDRLIGYHPFGRCSSSFWFHNERWLDFNMFQSGHRDYGQKMLNAWDDNDVFYGEDNYRYVECDRALSPVKPTLDGEPSYELIPHGLHDPSQPYWQAADVRRYAYWSLLSGAAGHTYGDNAVMQFWNGEGKGDYSALEGWKRAVHDAGSGQMKHARKLMEAIGFQSGRPAPEFLRGPVGEKHAYRPALLTSSAFCVYEYEGNPIRVDTEALPFAHSRGLWYDTVSGSASVFGDAPRSSDAVFTPPDRRAGQNDWALIIYDASNEAAILNNLA